MQQPLALLIKNATIFWEHEVFVDYCHSNTQFIFFLYFFSKQCENNGKNYSFNPLLRILILLPQIVFLTIKDTEFDNKNRFPEIL